MSCLKAISRIPPILQLTKFVFLPGGFFYPQAAVTPRFDA